MNMNAAVYRSSLKQNRKFLSGIIISVVTLIVCLSALFPNISSGSSYADLLKTLPAGMLNAIGMKGNVGSFNDYLNMNFYNSIYLYILMAYVIVFTADLISKPMEDTSLAYYLNSPVSRKKFLYSQAAVLGTGLLATCVVSVAFGIASRQIFAGGHSFSTAEFVKCNVMLGCIFLFLGSVSVLLGAVSRKAGEAVAYGSTVIITEYFLDMLVKISNQVSWMKYFTVFTLYDIDRIKNSVAFWGLACGILIAASCAVTMISAELFRRRDLYI